MKTVLLVDDSPTVLSMIRMLLAGEGLRLVTASNGLEAARKARSELPDLVIMDVVMPQLDGIETCRKLRAMELLQGVPIILVTTRSEPDYVARGRAAGCTDYLTKPLDGPELIHKVRAYLAAAPGGNHGP